MPGVRVARWYCPRGHTTFSLLPDFLAARLPGTLDEIEAVVAEAEAAPSIEVAVASVRTDIELPGALRWLRRRLRGVRAALTSLRGLLIDILPPATEPTIASFRAALGVAPVLVRVREIAAGHLRALPRPIGFGPRPPVAHRGVPKLQHDPGPDPPRASG